MLTRRTLLAAMIPPALQAQPNLFGDAEAYQQFMGRWSRLLAPPLLDFTGIPDAGKVLDVGSGTGALAFTIAEKKPHSQVVGIDPSKEYVAYASAKNPFPKRATFEVGDAQQLHFSNALFDHSLSLLVFNFIPDSAKALREVIRVTKPGGIISAAVWDYGGGMRMLRVFWDAVIAHAPAADKRDERHMPLCHQGELSALWEHAGLGNVKEQPLDITLHFKSFADFWDPFLLGQGPAGAYVKTLDKNNRESLRTEIKQKLSATSESAPLSMTARAWVVQGTVPDRR